MVSEKFARKKLESLVVCFLGNFVANYSGCRIFFHFVLRAHIRLRLSVLHSSQKPTRKLAASAFKYRDWMKVLAASSFVMSGKEALVENGHKTHCLHGVYVKEALVYYRYDQVWYAVNFYDA